SRRRHTRFSRDWSSDVCSSDLMFTEAPEAFTRVVADLNDDSVEDIALVLKSTSESAEALWVFLSGPDKSEWILLNKLSWDSGQKNVGISMRIDKAEPGSYESRDTGQKHYFSVFGLEYFRPGSSSSVFFWSSAERKFQQIWIGD